MVLILFMYGSSCLGQEAGEITAQKLENETAVADDVEPEDDGHDQLLEYHMRHRININTAEPEWLGYVLGLNMLEVQSFREYRKWLGPFADIMELQSIPGWGTETVRRILPFVKLGEDQQMVPVFRERIAKGEHAFLLRTGRVLEKSKGFMKNDSGLTPFAGDRQRLMLRYTYRFRNLLQWGITAEKDPGEPLIKRGYRKGFDFYSAHLAIRDFRFIRAMVLGDYHINFGQGLVHWQSMAFKKSAETIQALRQGQALRPYNGTDENRFHRGAGIALGKKQWSLLLFLAIDKTDGNLVADTGSLFNKVVSSFQTSGLHRTVSEIDDKDALRQKSMGGQIGYRQGRFKFSFNGIRYQFSNEIRKENEPHNLYAISGKNWFNYSIEYGFTYKNLYLFGEAALDKKKHHALIQGILASLHPSLDFSLVYRNLSPAYRAIQSNAFTENAEAQNENGIYAGFAYKPRPGWRLDAYIDVYQFPWVTYRTDRPATGFNELIQVSFKPNKKLDMYLRYQNEVKALNETPADVNLNVPVSVSRRNLRWQCAFHPDARLAIRNRIELNWFEKGSLKEQGFQAYIDFIYKDFKKPYSISFRIVWFQTDGYNSRVYGYEQDVLYYYAISALFDSGSRAYILFHYNIHKKWQVWTKVSASLYTDNQSVGSGLSEIFHSRRTELRFQVQYRL